MPKTQNRHQRRYSRLRAENDFNRVMKEYVTLKYGPIAEEFCGFYDQLRDKYPDTNVYKNTKQFRQWVKDEITKYIDEHDDDEATDNNNNNNNNTAAGENENDEAGNYAAAGENENDEAGNYAAAGENENDEAGNYVAAEPNIINKAIEQADQQVNDIIRELENGGVPLSNDLDDEGINLDLFEELRGISEDFDYELEIENDNVFW